MAFSLSAKLAGLLRGLRSRPENRVSVSPPAAAPAPVPVPAPVPAPPRRAAMAKPVPPSAPVPPPARTDGIELPLASVISGLPLELRGRLSAEPRSGQTILLPTEMVVSQLAFGAVKMSFGELRQLAPGIFADGGVDIDNKSISLPLRELLPRLNPALLARRNVRKVEVAEEIVGPFSGRGRGFSFTTQPLKAPAAPIPAPAPALTPREPANPILEARRVSPAVPLPSLAPDRGGNGCLSALSDRPVPLPSQPPRAVQPVIPLAANGSIAAVPNRPVLLAGRLESANDNGRSHIRPPVPIASDEPPQVIRMAASVPGPSVAPQPGSIPVRLAELCERWPDTIKAEILNSSLLQASVPLDQALILPGLKRGRVAFSWKQIRLLVRPDSVPSPLDNLELELPLKVIAPLFLAAQGNSPRAATKVAVSSSIPDLFFGFPQPAAAVPAAPVTPVTPVMPVTLPPLPAAQPSGPETNYFTRNDAAEAPGAAPAAPRRPEVVPQTDFMSRLAHPKDVVARAAALPGVAGAVVAMQDGLRVASQVPLELNADTVAAFLPQIFDRVGQSTRELRMGALNNLSFTVGGVPWKIFRVNAVYFAIFGRAGESLPSAELVQLAAELDRKKNQ